MPQGGNRCKMANDRVQVMAIPHSVVEPMMSHWQKFMLWSSGFLTLYCG